MRLSDLQNKDVINLIDGKMMGNIVDVIIEGGNIQSLIVAKSVFILSLFFSKKEIEINWSQVKKIGSDVILVEVVIPE